MSRGLRLDRGDEPPVGGVADTFARQPLVLDQGGLQGADVAVLGAPFDDGASHRPGAKVRAESDPRGCRRWALGPPSYDARRGSTGRADRRCLRGGRGGSGRSRPLARRPCSTPGRDLDAGAIPLVLGGDHSLSLPTLRVLAERHGPDGYAVLHLDTHADTADQLYGVRVSHGTPFRVPRAYLSVDIDVLDPAFTPGTGTPEPGGLTTRELLWTVRPVREGGRIGALEKRTERSELSRALNRDARERGR